MPVRYEIIPVTPFEQNCTILICPDTGVAALVDPGGDIERLLDAVARLEVTPDKLLLTHGHLDHVGGAAALSQRLGIPVIGPHRDDEFLLSGLPQQAQMFGFPPHAPLVTDQWLVAGDCVAVGNQTLEVLHCPGHTPGHVVFFHRPSHLAVVGDVLFRGSIGRTDFPRGNHADLLRSIRTVLFPLGDDVRFIPGHGPMGTLGQERRTNPYVGEGAR